MDIFSFLLLHIREGQENRRRKKKSFLKCIQKLKVIKKIWVLVFSFMYLVSVDPMDRSKEFE